MEVWQHMKLTGTNQPCGLTITFSLFKSLTHHYCIYLPLLFDYLSFDIVSSIFGGNSEEDTPVPFPNTEVKPARADGTAWAAGWESRSMPKFSI